jgi:signal transduction histidine kinase
MRSLLGRRIEVSVQVDGSTAPVRVDGAELELALLHLALDARDAMPGGGELRLRAGNASAEDRAGLAGHPARAYVVITVGDDGVGHGAAAGLSHAHAVCSQAGGTARLDSTPGVGSTVSLLLPAWRGDDVAAGRSGDHR